MVKLLTKFKDYFAWDYDEIPRLNRDLVELKILIRPDKRPMKKIARRFAPKVMSKIK